MAGFESRYYVLNEDGRPVPARAMEWALWLESHHRERVIAQTRIGDAMISTVFLGLDHSYDPDGPPLLFETMISGGPARRQETRRYTFREEAEQGHAELCELVRMESQMTGVRLAGSDGEPGK